MPLLVKLKVFLSPEGPTVSFIFPQSPCSPACPLGLERPRKKIELAPREKLQLLKNGKQGHHHNILNVDCSREQGDVSGMRMV